MKHFASTIILILTLTIPTVGFSTPEADESMYSKDQETLPFDFLKDFEELNAEEYYSIGRNYYFMYPSTPESCKKAVNNFQHAANKGHLRSHSDLGSMYKYGICALQDYKEAIKWFRMAAEQGDLSGQFSMGLMYYQGKGVIQNYIEAHKWFNISGERKHRDDVEQKMTTEQVVEAQKLAREWMEEHQKN